MADPYDPYDEEAALTRVKQQAGRENVRITVHAAEEMIDEDFAPDDLLEALEDGRMVENYPEARTGPRCPIHGRTRAGRNTHVVCTTDGPTLAIIAVYEPKEPRWTTPTTRGNR